MFQVYRPPPLKEGEKIVDKPHSEKKPTSADFYKHVQSQHKRRDRYGTDVDHVTAVKKVCLLSFANDYI